MRLQYVIREMVLKGFTGINFRVKENFTAFKATII